jgi:hypothetical protein
MRLWPSLVCSAAALAVAATPLAPASAHDWHYYHHGGPILGVLGLGAAIVGTAAAIATAPLRAVAPVYVAPPVAYAPPPAYYYPPPYAYAPGYYYAPRYYYRRY